MMMKPERIEKGPEPTIGFVEPVLFRKMLVAGVAAAVALAEAFDASFRINVFRFTGVKRVTVRAGVHMHFLDGRTGVKLVPASALDHRFRIFGMYVCFHDLIL